MELQFSEEHQVVRQLVRDFAQKEITPFIATMEETDVFPHNIVDKMAKLGLLGIPIPKAYGGQGKDFLSYIITINEISKVSATVGVILSVHTSVGTYPILHYGNEAQKRKYIPKLASGKYLGAFALTEPNSGSDVVSIQTRAMRDGEYYRLNGGKSFITNGGVADTYIVFAKTDPTKAKDGMSAFIVEKDTPGFIVGRKEKKMGLHGSNTTPLLFDNALVPVENRIGMEGQGLQIALANLDVGRIGIAAQALGIAEAALDYSIHYARNTTQSKEKQQSAGYKLADIATNVEAARLLIYRAVDLHSRGKSCNLEASIAKLFTTKIAMKSAMEAVQIFGEDGYSKDQPVERLFRDAKVTEIYEGTSEIQRIVISKRLLAD